MCGKDESESLLKTLGTSATTRSIQVSAPATKGSCDSPTRGSSKTHWPWCLYGPITFYRIHPGFVRPIVLCLSLNSTRRSNPHRPRSRCPECGALSLIETTPGPKYLAGLPSRRRPSLAVASRLQWIDPIRQCLRALLEQLIEAFGLGLPGWMILTLTPSRLPS